MGELPSETAHRSRDLPLAGRLLSQRQSALAIAAQHLKRVCESSVKDSRDFGVIGTISHWC